MLVKFDKNGNTVWAKSAGSNAPAAAKSIKTDISGNIYVAGYYNGTSITFGATTLTNTNPGLDDFFILKYDGAGNSLWAKSGGGSTNNDEANAVAVNAAGNCYVAGYFKSSTVVFGSTTLTNVDSSDIFIAKLGTLTGINDKETLTEEIKVYPNPTTGQFTVFYPGFQVQNSVEMRIYNLLGNVVYSETLRSIKEIFMMDVPTGIYFLQLKSGNNVHYQKLVKE